MSPLHVAAAAGGCFYSPSDRCSAGEQLDENDICVCMTNYAPVKRDITVITPASSSELVPIDHCEPCAANQVVSNGACVCGSGLRARAERVCPQQPRHAMHLRR